MSDIVKYRHYQQHCDNKRIPAYTDEELTCSREPGHLGDHQDYQNNKLLYSWDQEIGGGAHGAHWKSLALSTEPLYICACCGALAHWGYIGPKPTSNYCFSCNLWETRLSNLKNNQYIIGGTLYSVGKRTMPSDLNGCAGRWFFIEPLDGSETIKTCDLWFGGDLPNHFLIPDTARFIQ